MAMKPRSMKKKPMAMKRGGKAKMMRGGGMMAKKPMVSKSTPMSMTPPCNMAVAAASKGKSL